MTTQSADFPVRDKIADELGLVNQPWKIWLRDLRNDVNSNSTLAASAHLAGKSAAVVTTPFASASLSNGQYRISAFSQITTAAGVNSSVTVVFSFTKNAMACTLTGTAMTSNDPALPHSDVFVISIDPGTPVSYSTVYASNPANAAVYSVDLLLERVNA